MCLVRCTTPNLVIGMTKKSCSTLEKIWKRSHRIICGFECRCDILPSQTRRREERALLFFKTMLTEVHIIHHLWPATLPHRNYLSIPYSKTARRAKCFIPMCTYLYNYALTNCDLWILTSFWCFLLINSTLLNLCSL